MPLTPTYALPYPPAVGVAPDVPYWNQQLAEALDAALATIDAKHTSETATVTRGTAQAIPGGAWTSMAWSGVIGAATAGMWAAGQPARLVAPVAGVYTATAVVAWTTSAAESQFIRWLHNGATPWRGGGAYGINNECRLADVFRLAAGDWLEVQAYSTGARNTQALENMPRASLARVGL